MKQLRTTRRHRPDGWRLDPLPLDPRDPDIVRAKALARRSWRQVRDHDHEQAER